MNELEEEIRKNTKQTKKKRTYYQSTPREDERYGNCSLEESFIKLFEKGDWASIRDRSEQMWPGRQRIIKWFESWKKKERRSE